MYNIETKIKENRACFDDYEPDEGHEQRFKKRLQKYQAEEKKRRSLFTWDRLWKVAAVVFILLVPSVVFFENHQVNGAAEYPAEYVQAKNYYEGIIRAKEQAIQDFQANDTLSAKMKNEAIAEIATMKKQISLLEEDYKKSSMDQRLFNALMKNYNLMTEMIDQVNGHMRKSTN